MTDAPFNATDYARQLLKEGMDRKAVVDAIVAKGRTRESAHGIVYFAINGQKKRLASQVVVTCRIAREFIPALRAAAESRGIAEDALASAILATVLNENMIDAVLDDREVSA